MIKSKSNQNSNRVRPWSRQPAVLRLLYDYGPLSREAIGRLVSPPMSKRRTNHCLSSLVKKGLVLNCTQFQGSGVVQNYQLSYNLDARREISKILQVDLDTLNTPTFRAHDHEHSIICTYWLEYLRHLFPEAKVVRDFHLNTHPEISNRLMLVDNNDFYPDIMLLLKSSESSRPLKIAIEVERSLKSRKRLFRKINKLATRSFIDGVIYVCPSYGIVDALTDVYLKRTRQEARRIRHYGDYFMMFSYNMAPNDSLMLKLLNPFGEHLPLEKWVHTLDSHKRTQRRNEQFQMQPARD